MMVARRAGSGNLHASPMAAAGVSAGQRAGFVYIDVGAGSNSRALSGIEITLRNENNVTKLLRYQNERRRGGDGALRSCDAARSYWICIFWVQENGDIGFFNAFTRLPGRLPLIDFRP
jgi:hypothetical protein